MLNILIAYPYFTKHTHEILQKNKGKYRLIIDSGAFTAWNIGKEISLSEYCDFLKSIEDLKPFESVQLDVIGNPIETFNNLNRMYDKGYEVMPVFTEGENFKMLEKLYEFKDYIMVGGIASGRRMRPFVKKLLNENKDRKIHLLGYVDPLLMRHFKPESVDSSSWKSACRFGNLSIYNRAGELQNIPKSKFTKKPEDWVIREILNLGFKFSEIVNLGKAEAWRGKGNLGENGIKSLAQFVTTCANVKRAYEVEKNLGTKIYLACSDKLDINELFRAEQFLKERGVLLNP